MPRRSKGPRLWFRRARDGRAGTWFILDGGKQFGTGCSKSESAGAEKALADYIRKKHAAEIRVNSRDPSEIKVSDVLSIYARNIAVRHARPWETDQRLGSLQEFFGDKTLSDISGPLCREYALRRSTLGAARRELEDLRSAINHHRREGLHDRIVSVVLPPKSPPRERWLTRAEAARVIWAAWRYREKQGGPMAGRRTRRHAARFMVVARYMGSRAAVICGASIEPKRPPGRPWVDLSTGIFHGLPEGQRETKKRRQVVPVPPPLLAHMRRWRRRGQRYVVEWNGQPVTRVDKAHRAAVADAGLGPEVTPHIWRHTVATWMAGEGVPAKTAAEWLAMSEATFTRVYAKHDPSRFKDVHEALR